MSSWSSFRDNFLLEFGYARHFRRSILKMKETPLVRRKKQRLLIAIGLFTGLLVASGCTSTGTLGLLSNSETEADLGPHDSHKFHRVGAEITGTACRHFILGLVPWGDSDMETAMRDAFKKNPSLHADGLVHVSTSTSLYNFFPLYNVYTLTCTTVKGIPIRFDHSPSGASKPLKIGGKKSASK